MKIIFLFDIYPQEMSAFVIFDFDLSQLFFTPFSSDRHPNLEINNWSFHFNLNLVLSLISMPEFSVSQL